MAEQTQANGTVQDPESGLGTQDIDSNNVQSNGGVDSNNIAQSSQVPQLEDIGSDNDNSDNDHLPTVVNQQPVQSIPTQTFNSQAPQVQQNYNFPPPNFNQGINATPIYFVDRPKPPEIPYFKHHTLEQFNKYLINFENQCAKIYPDDREQWRTVLINKMSKEIKATLPPEAEYDWSY
ncbi:unnamed protein product, partial [Rotaria magnacalcarata]